jgi:hypothetical protein
MANIEYLAVVGQSGAVRRFRSLDDLDCQRGDRVVVRTPEGLEIAKVLCRAGSMIADILPEPAVGELLRLVSAEDDWQVVQTHDLGQRIFDDCRSLIAELALPLEVLDVVVSLDGRRALLEYLAWDACDERPLVTTLARRHDVVVRLANLALARPADAPDHNAGCGEPNCGKAGEDGGCPSCSSSKGGCSNCGAVSPKQLQEYFAGLREKMDARPRTPLL